MSTSLYRLKGVLVDVLNEALENDFFEPITFYLKIDLIRAYQSMRHDYLPRACNLTIETNLSQNFIVFELYDHDLNVEFINVVSIHMMMLMLKMIVDGIVYDEFLN